MDRIITASSSDQLKKKSPKIEKPINEATWGGGGGEDDQKRIRLHVRQITGKIAGKKCEKV